MASISLREYAEMGLVDAPCNLCGCRDTEILSTSERFGTDATTVICRRCGLMYLNPRWSAEAYARFYEEDYRRLMGESSSPREAMLRQRVHGATILEFCRDFVPRGGQVLDVGCSAGGVLRAFREGCDCRVIGIEPSLEQSAYARDVLGIEVRTGLIEDIDFGGETFDLVLITQTLNHMLDPRASLERLRRLLGPRGRLFLEVQNVPEYARQARIPFQVDHIYYFCAETLECLVRRIGFEPIRIDVDTAQQARQVSPYMWHRGACMHVRILAEKAEPDLDAPWPDWRAIRDTMKQAMARLAERQEAANSGCLRVRA
jgi:SAM-dependent methyltransferase